MSTLDDLRKLRENALGMPAYQLDILLDYTIALAEAAEEAEGCVECGCCPSCGGFSFGHREGCVLDAALNAPIEGLTSD